MRPITATQAGSGGASSPPIPAKAGIRARFAEIPLPCSHPDVAWIPALAGTSGVEIAP